MARAALTFDDVLAMCEALPGIEAQGSLHHRARAWSRRHRRRVPRSRCEASSARRAQGAAAGVCGTANAARPVSARDENSSYLVVSFTSSQNIGDLRISLANVSDVSVRTEAGAATFTTNDGRLIVSNAGGQASFDIAVPVRAASVEIRVANRLRRPGRTSVWPVATA